MYLQQMSSVTVVLASMRNVNDSNVAADRLLEEMDDMKIRDNKVRGTTLLLPAIYVCRLANDLASKSHRDVYFAYICTKLKQLWLMEMCQR